MSSAPTPAALGQAVRAYRQARGWTIEELADLAAMHPTYLSDIERGRSNPSIGKLRSLAEIFEIRLSALIAEAEQLD